VIVTRTRWLGLWCLTSPRDGRPFTTSAVAVVTLDVYHVAMTWPEHTAINEIPLLLPQWLDRTVPTRVPKLRWFFWLKDSELRVWLTLLFYHLLNAGRYRDLSLTPLPPPEA